MTKQAFGIIDAQRGFMPAEEGARLHRHGFGELPVPHGEEIIAPINRVVGAFVTAKAEVFTTQDWHPHFTAHFSETPDFNTNWPVHCMGGTLGAELHPELALPASSRRFIKGFEPLIRGEDDTSYSGHFAVDPTTNLSLPEWLRGHGVGHVYLGGLALDYCVGKTALDLKIQDGLAVTVVLDATRGISQETTDAMLAQFDAVGVGTITSDELLATKAA